MQSGKLDLLHSRIHLGHSCGNVVSQCRHTEHSAAIGHNRVTMQCRAGMKHHGALCFSCRQSGDGVALAIFAGITASRQHHTDRGPLFPANPGFCQSAINTGLQHRQQVAVEQWQHHLRFRIAEPGVELDDLRTGRRHHQAGIQASLIKDAFVAQTIDHRLQNRLLHFGQQFRRHHRRRRISAHTAGIGTRIAIADPLVVLRRHHRHDGEPIGESQQRGFFPDQSFFQNDLATSIAMHFFQHDFVNRLQRFRCCLGHHDAFSGGQSIRFDHDAGSSGFDIRPGGRRRIKHRKVSGRNAISLHPFLGKTL